MPRSPTRHRRRWRRPPAIWCAISPPGRTLPPGAQNVMELRRDFLDGQAGATFAGPRRGARRPAGLRPLLPPGDRGSRASATSSATIPTSTTRTRPRRAATTPARSRRSPAASPRTRASRTAPPRTRRPTSAPTPRTCRRRWKPPTTLDMAEELDIDESEAPERRPPPPHSEADPGLQGLPHPLRRGDRRRGSRRSRRARTAARLPRPAARAAEGRGRPPRQPPAAPAAGAAEPRLGLRPRGRHPRRRPAGARGGQPDDPAQLQDGARHRLPRHRGDAAPRQLRLDARPADLDRRDLGRRARPHPRALPGQGRDPRLHHPRLEGRPEPRGLARGAAPAPCPAASTISATSSTSRPRRRGGAPARTSA